MKSTTEAIHFPASMKDKGTVDPTEPDYTIRFRHFSIDLKPINYII
jgi:hypothetical protein